MNRKIVSRIAALLQAFVLAVAVNLSGIAAVGATGTITVSGIISDQNGAGVSGVSVTATAPGDPTVVYGPVQSSATGSYQLGIDVGGNYDLHFAPPAGSGWNEIVQSNVAIFSDQTINIQLVPTPTSHALTGIFKDADGNPLPGVVLTLSSRNFIGSPASTTDTNGHFSITVQPGIWNLFVKIKNAPSLPTDINISGHQFDLTSNDINQDMQLPLKNTATLTVITKDSAGNAISGAVVSATPNPVSAPLFSGDSSMATGSSSFPLTDSVGSASAIFFDGAAFPIGGPNSTTSICATFSDTSKVCSPTALTLTGSATVTITKPATHTFSGTLTNADGNPIPNAVLKLSSIHSLSSPSSTTDASGHFSITVKPDNWNLSITMQNVVGYPQKVTVNGPTLDLTTSDINQDLQFPLKNTATLTVAVQDSAGNPLANVSVGASPDAQTISLFNGSTSHVTVTSNFPNTDVSGTTSATFFDGSVFSVGGPNAKTTICANFGTLGNVCSTTAVTLNGNTTVTITKPNTAHVFSGTLRDANANPIPNASFSASSHKFQLQNFKTDANGHFSITLQPDVWTLFITIPNAVGAPQHINISGLSFDLSTNDVTQDMQLPSINTVQLTVTVKDGLGNPVSGLPVDASGTNSIHAALFSGDSSSQIIAYTPFAVTDSNGSTTATFYDGAVFQPGKICGFFSNPPSTICNSATTTLNGNTGVILQQVPPALPDAPSNLAAGSPTQNPALSWSAVSGAAHYNIYRDGVKIDSSNTTNYTDTSAQEGARSYYVTTVSTSGESSPSTSVNVLVDRTNPTITYTANPSPNASGWNNSDVTLTFSCNDDSAGVQSCPAPVTFSAEGTSPATTQTVTDNAGNSTTITTSPVNIDKTAPTLGNLTWSANPLAVSNNTTLSVNATDSLSGVNNVYYTINGGLPQPMTFNSVTGTWSAAFGAALAVGTYNIDVFAVDSAGNTQGGTNDVLVVYGQSSVKGHVKTLPTTSDALPIALDTSNNPKKLSIGFTNIMTPASGSFDISYVLKNNQDEFDLPSTTIDWVVVQDANHASILGHGNLTKYENGVQSVVQNMTVRIDIVSGTSAPDHITVNIFSPGVNPNTGSATYTISDDILTTGSNLTITP